jgi:hypothetical protein
MAMTQRTTESRAARQQAELVVDLFIDVLCNGNAEIARESRSVIGALVDFRGEIPRSSGFAGFCKLAAKIDRMKRITPLEMMACYVVNRLSDRQVEALVCDRAYRGRTKVATDPFHPDKPLEVALWDDVRCAQSLRCTVATFRQRIYDGYGKLESVLGEHQPMKKAA